jgi:CHAD domain-containing protein/CYTH domain-containing protein
LSRSPQDAVVALGVTLLDDARAARERLGDPDDDEALHDFRVALRRLRSVLRAFRPYLDDPPPKKLRNRMRTLAQATNEARDSEVQIVWIRSRRDRLTRGQRTGATWLLARLESRRRSGYEVSRRAVAAQGGRLDRRTRKWLTAGRGWREAPLATDYTFAGALSELLKEHEATLEERLLAVRSADDQVAVHSARIGVKRLRYLCELVSAEVKPAGRAVRRLRGLQDVLGELHDALLADREFAAAAELAAAEHARRLHDVEAKRGTGEKEMRAARRRNATPGMLALARLGREAQQRLYGRFTEKWHDGGMAELKRDLDEAISQLSEQRVPPVEIERKYLLAALPEAVRGAESVEIDQGWLPGERLQERLRRASNGAEDRFYRTVKLGRGITRTEIEEEAPRQLFEQLWPLTDGRRLRKRRYYVPEGALTWEIDEFLDRELVLAEVELPAPETQVSLPGWLAPLVEREVTGEAAYLNVNLAQ